MPPFSDLELTVLCENSVAGPFGLIGEHGWALHIRAGSKNYLFDTGQGIGIMNNCLRLGIDPAELDALILSHGHYDHTSGLPAVLEQTGEIRVFAHPDCFLSRTWEKDGTYREIGIRYRKEYLESLGARFCFEEDFKELAPGLFFSGQVPRVTDFEPPDCCMKIRDGQGNLLQDPINDDASLILESKDGLVVVLGCAHAGLINILNHVKKNMPNRNIHTVIGGTHLGFAGEEQFGRTLAVLKEFGIKRLGAGHCTGLANSARLFHELGDGFFFTPVGTQIRL